MRSWLIPWDRKGRIERAFQGALVAAIAAGLGVAFLLASAPVAGAVGAPLRVGVFRGHDASQGSRQPYFVGPKAASPLAAVSHARVPDPEQPPFSTHGKLLIWIGGQKASCSATVINTPNNSTVVSAAHCVRSGFGKHGIWAKRAVFIPAYDRGRRPYGSFLVARAWVPHLFWKNENPNFDVSVMRVKPNHLGKVANVVGARGWATDVSRNHRYTLFGYPAGQMRGEQMRTCTSRVFGIRMLSRRLPGPAPSRVVCDMAAGSSGGGWIYGDGYLNSVIGYATRGRPGILYGPYFGTEIRRLINRVG